MHEMYMYIVEFKESVTFNNTLMLPIYHFYDA